MWSQMPVFAGLFLVIVMGSAGLPALSGFVGEFATLFGTFNAGCEHGAQDGLYRCVTGQTFPDSVSNFVPHVRVLAGIAATGVILGAVYLLFMFHKVFFGKLDKAKNGKLADLRGHELATFIPLVILIVLGGLFPRPITQIMEPSVQKWVLDFDKRVSDCADKPNATPEDQARTEVCRTTVHEFGLPPPLPPGAAPAKPADKAPAEGAGAPAKVPAAAVPDAVKAATP
jgi:NADH-quinone oxidoreductase subunit M